MFKVKIQYYNDTDEIILPGQQSLLTELEARNILVDFNCRQGHCGSCIAQLLVGEVRHFEALYPLNDNEILLCNSKPVSDISIKIH